MGRHGMDNGMRENGRSEPEMRDTVIGYDRYWQDYDGKRSDIVSQNGVRGRYGMDNRME